MRVFLAIIITFACSWFLLTKVTIEIPAIPEVKVTIPQVITGWIEKGMSSVSTNKLLTNEKDELDVEVGELEDYGFSPRPYVLINLIYKENEETDRTKNYVVAFLVDGEMTAIGGVLNFRDKGEQGGELLITGSVAREMLDYIGRDYERAEDRLREFRDEQEGILWDIFTGHRRFPSHAEMQRLTQREEELQSEVKRQKGLIAEQELPIRILREHISVKIEG